MTLLPAFGCGRTFGFSQKMLKPGGMWGNDSEPACLLAGEADDSANRLLQEGVLDTDGGRIRVEWGPLARVAAFGPLRYSIHFQKTSGHGEEWANVCPLIPSASIVRTDRKIRHPAGHNSTTSGASGNLRALRGAASPGKRRDYRISS